MRTSRRAMTEAKLWNLLKEGSHEALETIYRTHIQSLYDYGNRFSVDSATVEDCIQELFIHLWDNRESIGETDSIKPYLLISLRRKILKTIKRNRKSTDVELSDHYFDTSLDIESILIQFDSDTERKEKLNSAFNTLSDRQKEILYLKYYSGMDYEEISNQMDVNYQSARNLLHRAILKLAKYMHLLFILFLTK